MLYYNIMVQKPIVWISLIITGVRFGLDCIDMILTHEDISNEKTRKTLYIHLQYRREPTGIYITHLDQEYVFYTEDEFDIRRRDPAKKGTARPRVKSFKVDNSRIPFDFDYTVQWKDQTGNLLPPVQLPFLCYVLDFYFQHKELLREYFQNLPQPE